MTYDFIAIGESLSDAFYFIDEATVSCTIHKERCLLCFVYAEKIPVTKVVKVAAAGNSSNAVVGAQRLGLATSLITWIGKDYAGEYVKKALTDEGVDLRYLVTDTKHPTSEATILNYQGERTQLVYFQPRAYALPRLPKTRCVYYSAMGDKHASFDKALVKELERQPKAFFAFQPGTTHVRTELKLLKPLIARSDLFILNKEEAAHILDDGKRPLLNTLEAFRHYGAKIVIVTDGQNGADAFDGKTHWHMPIFDGPAKERTGAGDSFACGVTTALLLGKDLPTALRWGTANSWSVVQLVGPQAGLLKTREMNKVLNRFRKVQAKKVMTLS